MLQLTTVPYISARRHLHHILLPRAVATVMLQLATMPYVSVHWHLHRLRPQAVATVMFKLQLTLLLQHATVPYTSACRHLHRNSQGNVATCHCHRDIYLGMAPPV